jgi:putative pyruvate formate lyase activating enzyme
VLPEGKAGSAVILPWIAEHLGPDTHVALMSQYFPAGKAASAPVINRTLTVAEYDQAVAALEAAGLENGWVQELDEERQPV